MLTIQITKVMTDLNLKYAQMVSNSKTFRDMSTNTKLWILEISITGLWLVVAGSTGIRGLKTIATPGLPQSEGHSGYKMSHLSCLDKNVTLLVPDTKPQEVVLGSPETKFSTLVSTMREEKCFEKMIEDTRSAFMILSRLKSTTDPDAMEEL